MSDLTPADWARFYVDHGFELVEVKPNSKIPRKRDWPNCTTAPDHWEKNPDSNIGAKLGDSGIVSLDLDDLDATRGLFADFGIDLDALIAKAPTIQGQPGRLRVLFRATDTRLSRVALAWPSKDGELDANGKLNTPTVFELRGGHGYQDVLPPSRHPEGHVYQWLPGKALGELALPDLPPILSELWAGWAKWKPELERACPWAAKVEPKPATDTQRKQNSDVIGKWNQSHDIESILLAHGYEPKGKDRFLAPGSSSGLPGVKILDSGRVYSHHGSDPLGDGYAHDCFDVFRLLEHGGDFKAAVRDAASRLGLRRSEPPPANYEQDEHEPILVSLDNLGSIQPKPPAYLINPIIPRGHLTLLGGHGEAGKSQLKLTLGCHVAVGKPWAGLEVARGKVVVVSMEDPADIFLYRLKKIVREYAIDPVKLAANMTMIDASESGPLATEINDFGNKRLRFTPFAEKIRLLAQGADLLIIDGASDAYAADANSLVMVKQFLKTLISWVRGHGGAVLLLAHIDKSGARNGTAGNSYLGSVSWHNTPRSRLALVKDERVADTVHLKHEKLNLAKKLPEPITLQWNDDGVMVPVTTEVSAMVAKWAESTHDEDVYAAIKAALAAGVTIPTALTGAHTAWHMLLPFPELPTNLKTSGRGKKTVDAAMIRLQRAGRIRKETIKVNYKPRDRWVLADGTPQDEDA